MWRKKIEEAHDSVHLREWDLVYLHLNRIAWRCLTLKMVTVYYPLRSFLSPPPFILFFSRPLVLTLFRALPLNSPFAAAPRSRSHRVHRLRGNKGNLLPAG